MDPPQRDDHLIARAYRHEQGPADLGATLLLEIDETVTGPKLVDLGIAKPCPRFFGMYMGEVSNRRLTGVSRAARLAPNPVPPLWNRRP
jgi:hypothetical protein